MIEYKTGNILLENTEAIINTVNCVGVMGRGIALQFKKAFPENYKVYAAACKRKEVQPGQMFIYDMGGVALPRYIINFPTKRHWRGKSRIEDIEAGLKTLVGELRIRSIKSVAIPPLGSGLGGLEWATVRHRIEQALANLDDMRIIIFEPNNAPAIDNIVRNQKVPNMTPGRATLVMLIHRYLGGLLDPFVTLLEVHKLMYFMQEAGEPLRLKYTKAPYGPYAENLRHVLHVIEGHLVSGYFDGGDAPNKPLQLVPRAIEDAVVFLEQYVDTKKRLEKVTKLVEGFESPFGLELLATVHWVIRQDNVHSNKEIVEQTYAWNDQKRQFTRRQIILAADVLKQNGW
ncbi:MAG: macro domain-containing protein [Thiomargarita sp.]|nr:macro domain-containing protein [Thiomargarita sp.]